MNLDTMQKAIYDNKANRKFNVTEVGKEIILMTEELGELARAYKNSDKKPAREISNKPEIVDAIGDLMVYCLGLSEMMGISAQETIEEIIENNTQRTHTGHL